MLIQKTDPVGIDWYIQNAQKALHTSVMRVWEKNKANIEPAAAVNYECYGRCYRNQIKNGYVAEVYQGDGEYKEVYWNDNLDAISFFGISDDLTSEGIGAQADVHLVFFVNVKKLYPNISHHADEEVRQDVYRALGKNSYSLNYTGTELWLENVLKEYSGSMRDDRLKHIDMHPIHCFRLNYKLLFDPNKRCKPLNLISQ